MTLLLAGLRFVRDQFEGLIPDERIVQSLRLLLDNRPIVDLVVPDLAYHRDWNSIDRLIVLFRSADEDESHVRRSVVHFLLRCPEERAKELLEEVNELDPQAVKRVRRFYVPASFDEPRKSNVRIRIGSRGNSVFRC